MGNVNTHGVLWWPLSSLALGKVVLGLYLRDEDIFPRSNARLSGFHIFREPLDRFPRIRWGVGRTE